MNFLFVCTHPIQNLIPLFVELNNKKMINFKVLYWEKINSEYFDSQFNQKISFNIETYQNYSYEFLYNNKNNSKDVIGILNQIFVSIKLIKYILFSKEDAVLVYGYYFPHIILLIFSKLLRKKTIIRSVSYNLGRRSIFKKIVRKVFYIFSNLFIDEFWSIGELNTQFYLNFGVKKKNIKTIPSSQINKEFVFKDIETYKISRLELINKHSEIKDKKIILYPGKFLKKKRPMFLIEAFLDAKIDEDWILVMVGGGGFYHKMVTDFLKKNKPKNIFFFGFKDLKEVLILYDLAEIVVLPSDYGETNGNVLLECSQFNCCCIASDRVGAYPEIQKYDTGLIFEASKKIDLTEKIKLLTKDDNLRAKLKENNLKFSKLVQPSYAADKISKILINNEL